MADTPGRMVPQLFLALLVAPLVLFSALAYWSDYTEGVRRSEDLARAVAQAADERISGSLRTLDLLLQYIADYAGRAPAGSGAVLAQALTLQARSMPEIELLLITDADGILRIASTDSDRFADVAYAQFFEVQQAIFAARRVVIDGPMPDGKGGSSVVVSRPVISGDGRFLGVVAAVLRSDFFTDPLRQIAPDTVGAVTLFNSNGIVLSRYPAPETWAGRSFADTPLFRGLTSGGGAGLWHSDGEGDGAPQVVAWRNVERYPLVVTAAIPLQGIVDAWWYSTRPKMLAEAGLILLLGYIGLLLRRRDRALAHSNRDLARLNTELEQRVVERTSSLAQEIAERRRIEDELFAAKEAAEAASQAKSRFLAVASHDLRQPVQALNLYASVLAGRRLGPDEAVIVDRLRRSAASVAGLLDSLLDISKLDAGVVRPDSRPVPLSSILDRLWQDLCPAAEAVGVSLSVVSASAWIHSDPALLVRILQNLVSNAIRYTPPGGKVVVGCRHRGNSLALQVWDNGIGIPEDKQAVIFEEFTQLGTTVPDRPQGLGLGLAIVRRLAALLGHRLDVWSAPGRGSRFELCLPLAPAPARIAPMTAAEGMARPGDRLLVIDDEAEIRHSLALQLEEWGFSILTAESGAAALAIVARTPIDGIIVDFRLPGETNGIDLARCLLAQAARPLPVLLLTGDTEPDRLREAMASGFRLLHKPATPEALRTAVLGDDPT